MDGIQDGNVQGDNAPGQNPAWNDVLSVIPEQYHAQVTPHFQQWDQSAQQRIEQANSSIKEYEPYKQFVDNNIPAEDLEQGIRLMYEINTNPKSVYDALAEAYNLGTQPNVSNANAGGNENTTENTSVEAQNLQDPRFDKLQEGLDLVGQVVLQDQQRKAAEQADRELANELDGLRKEFGDFDESYVLAMMGAGKSGKDAVQAFQEFSNNLIQSRPRPFAPNVMGSSGGGSTGLPSQAIDPTKLSGKDTRNLVVEMLRHSAEQDR